MGRCIHFLYYYYYYCRWGACGGDLHQTFVCLFVLPVGCLWWWTLLPCVKRSSAWAVTRRRLTLSVPPTSLLTTPCRWMSREGQYLLRVGKVFLLFEKKKSSPCFTGLWAKCVTLKKKEKKKVCVTLIGVSLAAVAETNVDRCYSSHLFQTLHNDTGVLVSQHLLVVYTHTRTHTHTHTYTHAHAHTPTHIHTHTHTHTYTHPHIYTRTDMHRHACTHTHTDRHARMRTHTHAQTHTRTRTDTHTRTRMHTNIKAPSFLSLSGVPSPLSLTYLGGIITPCSRP